MSWEGGESNMLSTELAIRPIHLLFLLLELTFLFVTYRKINSKLT